jgi:predicted nucleotidyltransferase
MTEMMTMLDLDDIDLDMLTEAMDDHSYESSWWLDPSTGAVEYRGEYDDSDDDTDPEALGWVPIEPTESGEAYGDMETFIARVGDPRARDLLERAITGRGAFRRFKDTLFEFPELRKAWFALRDARANRRAVQWLLDKGLIDERPGQEAIQRYADPDLPELGSTPHDIDAIIHEAVTGLRALYGDRLREVLLYGSYARGEAHEESDIDLLVVLTEMASPYEEIEYMGEVMWDLTERYGIVVSAQPVSADRFARAESPFLQRVHAEAKAVA